MFLLPRLPLRQLTFFSALVALCAVLTLRPVAITQAQASDETAPELDGIKTYLLEKAELLQASSAELAEAAEQYYDLAKAADFDYEALWAQHPDEVAAVLTGAKDAWIAASPLYEQIEGVVAGVPDLSEYDVILDAGSSAEEDPTSAVPFDLTLPDGRVLEQPGNLFGLLEATLWGTRADFTSGIEADLDASGEVDFGELLPEANMLFGAARLMHDYTDELMESAEAWEPNITDAFTALVVMTPTMSEYFASWKESRFIAGNEATRTDFVVISRLADIQDILGGLEVIHNNLSPLIQTVSSNQDAQIGGGLADLRNYVADLYQQEQDGRVFTPEEADFYGSEAQYRAMSITGQIAQVAALLDVELPEQD